MKSQIAIFFHVKISGGEPPIDFDWATSLLAEMLIAMRDSGIAAAADRFFIGVNGDEADAACVESMAPSGAIVTKHPDGSRGEHPTLRLMQGWCRENIGANVMYCHLKGATHTNDQMQRAWNQCMSAVVIWNWQGCIKALDAGYDLAGPHWVSDGCAVAPVPNYFAGNFFWGTAKYLASLPLIAPTAVERLNFYDAEVLVAKGPRPAKAMKFANHWPGAKCLELMERYGRLESSRG